VEHESESEFYFKIDFFIFVVNTRRQNAKETIMKIKNKYRKSRQKKIKIHKLNFEIRIQSI